MKADSDQQGHLATTTANKTPSQNACSPFVGFVSGLPSEKEAEQKQRVYDLWMRCETQERVAEQVGVPQRTVADWIASFSENGSEDDSAIFRDFEPELYTVAFSPRDYPFVGFVSGVSTRFGELRFLP